MLTNARKTYLDYPRNFWVLMGAGFIDRVGGAMLFPFFALYITAHFEVGMTQVGVLFVIFGVTNAVGGFIGGAIADKFGRRAMIIFGLVVSASSSIMMAFVDDINIFYLVGGIVGLFASAGEPAQGAMVADLLPENKLTDGYGIQRVVQNLAVAIGPAIGGFLATRSFLYLFIGDAITSIIMAIIVYSALPETKPATPEGQQEESMAQSLGGYSRVFADRVFMAFLFMSALMILVYAQMNTTLPVYMRDSHGLEARYYGYILSLNASMVVTMQFWITRRISKYAPMIMMAIGTLFYVVGFGMIGFISAFSMFVVSMVIITIGEMFVTPVAQALVARLAPADMRGRYMAIFGFSFLLPFTTGPLLAGLVIDNLYPELVWYLAGLLGLVAAIGFAWLHLRVGDRVGDAPLGEELQAEITVSAEA
jgi:MFS family permease